MKRVLIFAGAGASCAVQPSVYPTTVEFYRRLENLNPEIVSDPSFADCVSVLGRGDKTVDIEQVLWEVERSISALELLLGDDVPLAKYIARDAPKAGHEGRGLAQQIPSLAQRIRDRLVDLRAHINACVFELYGTEPLPGWLTDNWTWMLSELAKRGWRFDIATTNYDLVIEEAIRQSKTEINDFYSGNPSSIRRLDVSRVLSDDAAYRGSLLKLHGSINWQYQDDGSVALGGASRIGDEKKHAVIYPGFKGAPAQEPFVALHRRLSEALPTYSGAIFIGFGFRDDYLNRLFEGGIGADCRVSIVNRSPSYQLPALRTDFIYRTGEEVGFEKRSAQAAIDYLDGIVSSSFIPAGKRNG